MLNVVCVNVAHWFARHPIAAPSEPDQEYSVRLFRYLCVSTKTSLLLCLLASLLVQAGLERQSGVRPRGASKPVMVDFITATWNSFDEFLDCRNRQCTVAA